MWGIIAITHNGLILAKKLKTEFPNSVVYTLEKWNDNECEKIEGDLSSFTGELFKRHRTLVFIMATGIVVRCIAKHLKDKTTDPAIVVMDEQGQFVISLLSGHLGGANEITEKIAQKLHATAVITTSSDVQGLPSVDMIAKEQNLFIPSMDDVKNITAMIVNGKKVALRNESSLTLPSYFTNTEESAEGLVVVSNRLSIECAVPFAQLIPRNITIGVGCRRGILGENIIAFIQEQLDIHNIHPQSIYQIASTEIKSDEQGILDTAAYFKVLATFIKNQDIEAIEDQFTKSEFVKSNIGIASVCEPSAFIAAGRKGHFISKKQAKEGITVAIFESAN
jgi:cobalt-precorrin 5A hydrolase